jgi:hypothetical protein
MITLLDEFEQLPQGIDSTSLVPYYDKLFLCKDKELAFDALFELSDRQWHTYEMLDQHILARVENWLLENWNRGSLDDAMRLNTIVAHLGSVRLFEIMKEEFPILRPDIQREFAEFFEEIGENVGDPYSEIRSAQSQPVESSLPPPPTKTVKLLGFE